MEVEESQNVDLEAKPLGLTNNNHFSENQADPNTIELPGSVSVVEEINMSLRIDAHDQLPNLNESTEPERTQRNGRYNLRKSLAWDSAFFTSSGVLDPEELSSMITETDKGEKHLLPGIEEDITGSTESISTLESDNLTLETLEADLFVDIRASIQRSSKKISNLTNSSSERAAMEVDSAAISSLKKENHASRIMLNPKPALKKTSGLQSIRMSKCEPKQNIGKIGSGKAKQNSGHSQSMAKICESNSSFFKPPKAVSRLIPTSTALPKRDSMGANHVKSESASSKLVTVSNKGPQPSKVSVAKVARRALPKPALPSTSFSLGPSTTSRVQSTRSSTSSNSSSSVSSETATKSLLLTARRNPVKSSHVGTASSGSIPKTPSRAALKKKPPPSTLSSYLMSTKITSSASPASSLSEWSSVSSSSSSMVNQRSNTNSCRSIDGDIILSDSRNHSTDQTADENKSRGIALPCVDSNKPTTQTGTLQALTKPSGLRMPSPKIGFFDGVKSLPRTPNGNLQSQSGLHTVFPKSGAAICSPTRSSNIKLMSSKVSTARIVTALAYTEPDSPRAPSPAFHEKSHAPGKDSSVSTDLNDSSSLSFELKSETHGGSCEKTQKVYVRDGTKKGVAAGGGAIINENLDSSNYETKLNMHKIMGMGDIKITTVKVSNASHSKYSGSIGNEDVLLNQNYLMDSSYPICKTDDKENGCIEDQGEGLAHNREINANASGPKDDPLSCISDLASVSVPTTVSESSAHRFPFALKNFYLDMPQESATQIADKFALALPSSEHKENN